MAESEFSRVLPGAGTAGTSSIPLLSPAFLTRKGILSRMEDGRLAAAGGLWGAGDRRRKRILFLVQ